MEKRKPPKSSSRDLSVQNLTKAVACLEKSEIKGSGKIPYALAVAHVQILIAIHDQLEKLTKSSS